MDNLFLLSVIERPAIFLQIFLLFYCWSPKCGKHTAGTPEEMNSIDPPIPQWVIPALTPGWDKHSIYGSQDETQKLSFVSGSLNGSFNPQMTLHLIFLSPW